MPRNHNMLSAPLPLIFLCLSFVSSAATYYVDAKNGKDMNAGTSPRTAWQSLDRVNRIVFQPGDNLLLRAENVWNGQLWPKGSGAHGRLIRVDRYGQGMNPIISGNGSVDDTLKLFNQEYWTISHLEITNKGPGTRDRKGVHVELDNFGTAHEIRLTNLSVHDVDGDLRHKDTGGIIWTINGDKKPSRFDGLLIENNHVYAVDRSAIAARSYHFRRDRWFPSLHVVIRRNRVDDIGGDGIVPWACDGALIEWNIVSNCNRRSDDYNAGVWPWSCDNTVVQHNEVFLTHGTKDGEGFDSDYNSRHTLIQYNYSHDNEGGFLLICNDGNQHLPANIGNEGTVVRDNVSRNDRTRIFHLTGPVKNTKIYRNKIFVGPSLQVNAVQVTNWGGWASDTGFTSNVFDVQGIVRYGHELSRKTDGTFEIAPGFGPALRTVFDGNAFYGKQVDRPVDEHAIIRRR